MTTGDALAAMYSWFGDTPFEIRHMDDVRVDELAKLTGIYADTRMGQRAKIGRWLTTLDSYVAQAPSGTYSLRVQRWADRSNSGLYQIVNRDLKQDLGETMTTTEERVSYIEGRLDSLATKEDIAALKGDLQADIAKAEVRFIRWTVGMMIALLAIVVPIAIAV